MIIKKNSIYKEIWGMFRDEAIKRLGIGEEDARKMGEIEIKIMGVKYDRPKEV